MPPLAIAIGVAGLASAGAGIYGAVSSKSAANDQVAAQERALDFQRQVYGEQVDRISPYITAGNTSLAKLMSGLQDGTFGPGSVPSFTAPTLEQARQTPGYEFTREQGNKGILEGAAAGGGAISGGTLKALDTFNTGLADSTYNDVFTRSLQTYQENLANQAQQFQQLFAPTTLGESAIASINGTGSQTAVNVGNLMSGIGNSQAAGTVGAANALGSGISGAANLGVNALLFNKLFGPGGGVSHGSGIDPFASYLAQQGYGPG